MYKDGKIRGFCSVTCPRNKHSQMWAHILLKAQIIVQVCMINE